MPTTAEPAATDLPDPSTSLAAALVVFQSAVPFVKKNQTATIPGKDGRPGYRYTYANLTDVTTVAYPLLTRLGLSFICLPKRTETGAYELVGELLHVTGESRTAALPISGRQAQDIGSSITYGRRYLLGCMTGLITDDDDDGALAQHTEQRLAADAPPVRVEGMTTADMLEQLVSIANVQGITLEAITTRARQDLGGIGVERLPEVPPGLLLPWLRRIEAYAAEHPATPQEQPA